jgi:trehalose 2-sulfotransferase
MREMQVRYMICTVPRSGSNYLCDSISQTEQLGMRALGHRRYERLKPLVADNFQGVNWTENDPLHLLESAFEQSVTANGVMGFKVMWSHLRRTLEVSARRARQGQVKIKDLEKRLAENTRFIWLRRRDQERQAISLTKAIQSNAWRSSDDQVFQGQYVYDFPGIAWRLGEIRRQETAWQTFFERYSSEPLTLYYEDYLTDLEGTIRRIGDWLGVPCEYAVQGDGEYQRQSSSLNEEWLRRYRQDASGMMRSAGAIAAAGASRDWWASFLQRLRSRI